MTHPFHPLADHVYTVVNVKTSWGVERVYYTAADGTLAQMPLTWTSLAHADPFVTVANGRSRWRVVDLLELRHLLDTMV